MASSKRAAFPVGLYGALLFALCWLVLPFLLAPLERALLGVALLPQRWFGALAGTPAAAASAAANAGVLALQQQLRVRTSVHDVEPARACMPAALTPLPCGVQSVDRIGGGGLPAELRLDRSYDELAGCIDLVTKGDQLLGFLARPGVGVAAADRPGDRARVLLLHHPQSRPVAAALLPLGEDALGCVVEAAAVVDPAPLRTTLHGDPYRAMRLREGGAEVRTVALDASFVASVPAGLGLGRTRVWGYERPDGDSLTIGVYVEPRFDPRALASVVVWQAVPEAVPVERPPRFAAARLVPLPDGQGGRWLLDGTAAVPDGAAVVQDGVCFGRARSVAFGQGIVTSLGASQKPWALLLLPSEPALAPIECFGEVVRARGGSVWFRPRSGTLPAGASGYVFTGANGAHCPPGLLLGRAEAEPGRNLLRIDTPVHEGPQAASVVVGAL